MTKSSRMVIGPKSMVFIQYAPSNYSNVGMGRSAWIENHVADHLIKSLKKPAKRAAGTRPVYVVRCYPKQIEGGT